MAGNRFCQKSIWDVGSSWLAVSLWNGLEVRDLAEISLAFRFVLWPTILMATGIEKITLTIVEVQEIIETSLLSNMYECVFYKRPFLIRYSHTKTPFMQTSTSSMSFPTRLVIALIPSVLSLWISQDSGNALASTRCGLRLTLTSPSCLEGSKMTDILPPPASSVQPAAQANLRYALPSRLASRMARNGRLC